MLLWVSNAAQVVLINLGTCFAPDELLEAMALMYPNSWQQDERVFSAWLFVENDLRSRMFRQDWWTVHNFPYDEALNV